MKKFKEHAQIDEAPLVMNDMNMVDALWNEVRDKIFKDKMKGRFEKHFPLLQQLAKYGGYKITKRGQDKDKTFRYDVKKWKHLKSLDKNN